MVKHLKADLRLVDILLIPADQVEIKLKTYPKLVLTKEEWQAVLSQSSRQGLSYCSRRLMLDDDLAGLLLSEEIIGFILRRNSLDQARRREERSSILASLGNKKLSRAHRRLRQAWDNFKAAWKKHDQEFSKVMGEQ